MSDLLDGIVVAVSSQPVGSQVVGTHAAGATVLTLEDTVDMISTGGFVTLEGVADPVEYVSSDDDASTITLAAPLTASLAAEAEVLVHPARVEVTALVLVDEASEPIPATVPWDKQDALPVGVREEEDREQVRLRSDGPWSWTVFDLVNQPLERASTYIQTPALSAYRPSSANVATGGAGGTINSWTIESQSTDVIYFEGSGVFRVTEPGHYVVIVTARWASNAVGRRMVWPVWLLTAGEKVGAQDSRPADDTPGFTTHITDMEYLQAGEGFSVRVFQSSGGGLSLLGGPTQSTTTVKVYKAGP